MKYSFFISLLFLLMLLICCAKKSSTDDTQWAEYLGGPDRNHYSSLNQINLTTVKNLKVAWEYHTLDSGQIQCNAIIEDGVLYGMTATTEPFALDAATGKELWRRTDTTQSQWYSTSRGVALWKDKNEKRIFYTKEAWLYALDAKTGEPVMQFGDSGKVSLKSGLGETAKDKFVISNTPGTIFDDLLIMPLRVSEGSDAAMGFVQAFNIRTGKVAWVFKTIPSPNEPGYETWPPDVYKNTNVGGANNWAGMAVDHKRGIVYVPTGSAAFDFYGGDRIGSNLYANTLLALDAKTGKKIWHFQMVHHDILDRDPPAPPNLLTVTHNGKRIDAVAQITKQGYIFLLDRENGTPLFKVNEVIAPASDVPGEQAWPTQPVPTIPHPYARQTLSANDVNPFSKNKDELISILKKSRSEGPFTPLSERGTIIFPGLDGGAEWGGAAVDPEGILYLNSSEMAWLISIRRDDATEQKQLLNPGQQLYYTNCTQCHGAERKGNPASGFPSLLNMESHFKRDHVLKVISSGKGMMPAFKQLTENEKKMLVAFLYNDKIEAGDKKEVIASTKKSEGVAYKISGYTKFLDNEGYPAISPPWGTLNAINMNTGEYVWKKVFGEYPELMAKGVPQTGSESYGGPVVTAGGLLFIAGTKDQKFRAYDKSTGDLVWETRLPAASFATPSTYQVNGKQFIVIACGGTKLGAAKGESYVAFALGD